MRVYVHNNAASNLNGADLNGTGVAKNSKVRIYVPTANADALRANAYVSASNANPVEVADTVDFYGANKFTLSYVAGSAVMYTNAIPSGFALSDSIVTTGAAIGYQGANGTIPGCFEYTGFVTIRVKVKMEAPNFTMSKQVSKDIMPGGSYSWQKNVVAVPSETVAYQLRFTNTGNSQLDQVVIRDQLPKGVTIVPGSTVIKYGTDPTIKSAGSDAIVSNGGLMIGNYAPTGGAVAMFKAVMPVASALPCGTSVLTNVGEARVNGMATTDTANVTVNKDCPNPPTPAYSCDALGLNVIGTRKIRVTTQYMAINGATLNNISYDFGDGSQKLVTKNTTVEYTYAKDGTYTVRATPSFTVNGKVVTADSSACAKVVTFTPPVTPPVTPPTVLPNTGPTQTIGLFIGASMFSAIAYRLWMIRRLNG